MAYAIGTLEKGSGDDCHYQLVELIKNLAEANGWTTLRYDTTTENHEWIGTSSGLSGDEEIFIGIQTYQSQTADYYNLNVGCFTGYVPANDFDTQPNASYCGVPAHNNAIGYFISLNAQRLAFMLKVGTPVYTHAYVGKFFTYARPSEYPNPLVCAGCMDANAETRFSATTIYFPYHDASINSNTRLYIRLNDGTWHQPAMYPFSHSGYDDYRSVIAGSNSGSGSTESTCQVPANNIYQAEPLIMHTFSDSESPPSTAGARNVFGELDGVSFVSGFNNGVENVLQIGGSETVDQTGLSVDQAIGAILAVGGRAFVMGQNITRTNWRDFVAIEMTE